MGKYLELFRGEVGDLTEKTKLENKPYVAYSTKLGKVTYTVVPKPVVGPADNEIWYTTIDGNIAIPTLDGTGYSIISNEYKNNQGVIKLNQNVPAIFPGYGTWFGDMSYQEAGGTNRAGKTLKTIQLPSCVTNIDEYAFDGCYDLTSITIPNSVISIGFKAFYYCISLESIYFNGSINEWNSIEKDAGGWLDDEANVTVHCTDGEIIIPAKY